MLLVVGRDGIPSYGVWLGLSVGRDGIPSYKGGDDEGLAYGGSGGGCGVDGDGV